MSDNVTSELEGYDTLVSRPEELDVSGFFTDHNGDRTLVGPADLEEAVPDNKKQYLEEERRYWLNKPYAFAVIYRSTRDDEPYYVLVEPALSDDQSEMLRTLQGKLHQTLDYDEMEIPSGHEALAIEEIKKEQRKQIRTEAYRLMADLGLIEGERPDSPIRSVTDKIADLIWRYRVQEYDPDSVSVDDRLQRKFMYYLIRDFVDYQKIDALMEDPAIEDISVNGYNSRAFVYHDQYGSQIPTNVRYGVEDLDRFVRSMANRAGGASINKRDPQVDASLPDGSRAQLELGDEVSARGTNFTIRQFNEVPYTPVDLINWHTIDLDRMVYLWLLIQHGRSAVFAGGTGAGKTTSLNALSLFIPSGLKIVSIEDTREIEIPQANWVPNVTRPGASLDAESTIDEYDLLESALRKRPNFIVMGEIRGEEGRVLLQAMNTGHSVLTTFHAESDQQVFRRLTEDPINAARSLFGALDLVSVQQEVRVGGEKVRRVETMTEIVEFDPDVEDGIETRTAAEWDQRTDTYDWVEDSYQLEEIRRERGWSTDQLEQEMMRRRVVLSYLIDNEINYYSQVAAVIQAYMANPEAILALIARDELEERIENLRARVSIDIDIDESVEQLVPRPDPTKQVQQKVNAVMQNVDSLLAEYRDVEADIAAPVDDTVPDSYDGPDQQALENSLEQMVANQASENGQGADDESDSADQVQEASE